MEWRVSVDEAFIIDQSWFDNGTALEQRIADAAMEDQGSLRTALTYLYLSDGPMNLPAKRRKVALPYLDVAERIALTWLYTRTNGSERKRYGIRVMPAARRARLRCERCGMPDVRTLNLDHINGRSGPTEFQVLCANCHHLKNFEDRLRSTRVSKTNSVKD
jgi:hypothetical protein